MTNVSFVANISFRFCGGAIHNMKSSPTIVNSVISMNSANDAGGLFNELNSSPFLINTILWENEAINEVGHEIYNDEDSAIELRYSLYLYGPDEVNAGDPDTDISLFPLNCQDVHIDLAGNPRLFNGRIDLGAYEFQGSLTSLEEISVIPSSVLLYQNYPNAFNPSTEIGFGLPEHSHVFLEVFDITGLRVSVLVDQFVPAGSHTVRFDASGLAGGVYLYRIQTSDNSLGRKMVLIK